MTNVQLQSDERIDQLFSQDIQIIQSASVFAFSLDAVLLAHFAKAPKGGRGLTVDLCAGNGAIGLFYSQKSLGPITEVELQPRLADMASRSILLNGLEDRMNVLNIDLADTLDFIEGGSAETVLCNPPYFLNSESSQKNPNEHLAIARHEITTNLDTVCQTASRLLKMNGKLFMVHRPDRLVDVLSAMQAVRLAPKRIQFVHPKAGKEANMVLIEAIKDGKSGGVRVLEPQVVYDDNGQYTPMIHQVLYGE
ncbi:tRNA1(Val) (adenine(37)-N6)-methyltransferase [Periweissella ghanensis]|uniref:tRNA1(Val) (Adenine(37)-N6)-methyltransferase n=1 Tax=Periweissella ghanensis TaxID=467997 RepID=A0ABM8ZE16_9LACO|nr:tRNA1(Val) (adenine(37)-N6)-methyltransferase [Periweissella ghanensis]MCM0600262.1 tRNA1(Val) (adenine(37)-N6)-methyltransferase [Periweissella ghanensis]CAH0419162.1 tRNA1(Val) (adenine(37)-N6)-methyltransferase [Periweissella ghanensis]